MKKDFADLASGVLLIVCLAPFADARAEDNSLAGALVEGEAHVELRFRYEHVDQDGFAKHANAAPLRIRLNYRSGEWNDWSAYAEFDHIAEVFLDDYNSGAGTSPGRTQYPVVGDPRGSDLNQLYLQYSPSPDWQLRLGRQRIVLDDHRFVGNVVWRQNEQTYDGLALTVGSIPGTQLFYGYVENVNRIFGDSVPAGDHGMSTHLLNASIKLSQAWSLIPYAYYIDNDDDALSSTSTFGARLAGKVGSERGSLDILIELATQSDAADNPVNFDADFAHVRVHWSGKNGLGLGADFESLGGDPSSPGMSFRTPLATLHAFQGWADQFLATPDSGIDDFYLTAQYGLASWTLQAVYHDLTSEAANGDIGTELDIAAGRKLGDRYGVLLKAAFFDADSSATSFVDTNKYWLMLTASF